MPTKTLKELSSLVGGSLVGDPKLKIKGVSTIEDARPGDLIFVLEERFLSSAFNSKASALVASFETKIKGKNAILVKNPRLAMAQILSLFSPRSKIRLGSIHRSAVIARSAKIGKRVTIYPFVYIGEEVEIGDDTVIYPS
ncbi:MAG: LpxD N-terminal domain-containing protein, partial [Candidatus Margulisiibacteriota bacterium]